MVGECVIILTLLLLLTFIVQAKYKWNKISKTIRIIVAACTKRGK